MEGEAPAWIAIMDTYTTSTNMIRSETKFDGQWNFVR